MRTVGGLRIYVDGKAFGECIDASWEEDAKDESNLSLSIQTSHEVAMHAVSAIDADQPILDALDAAFKDQDRMREMIDKALGHVFHGPAGTWMAKRESRDPTDIDSWISGQMEDGIIDARTIAFGDRITAVHRAFERSNETATAEAEAEKARS